MGTKVFSGKYLQSDEKLGGLYYLILDNGFEVYVGESAEFPSYRQTEPFIPNPDLSYEENAKNFCETLAIKPNMIDKTQADQIYASAEDLTNLRSDIDYLMLLNDADSATKEETE